MSDPKTDSICCNKCWAPLSDAAAVLTSCCHVFCTLCATSTFSFNSVLKCPACNGALQRDSDLEQLNLDQSKVRRALYGLPPTAVLEIAHASCGFWEYHRKIQLQRAQRDSVSAARPEEVDALKRELAAARAELGQSASRLTVLEKDCAIRAREIHRLENELDETARAKQRLQKLFESINEQHASTPHSRPSSTSGSRAGGGGGRSSGYPSPHSSPRAPYKPALHEASTTPLARSLYRRERERDRESAYDPAGGGFVVPATRPEQALPRAEPQQAANALIHTPSRQRPNTPGHTAPAASPEVSAHAHALGSVHAASYRPASAAPPTHYAVRTPTAFGAEATVSGAATAATPTAQRSGATLGAAGLYGRVAAAGTPGATPTNTARPVYGFRDGTTSRAPPQYQAPARPEHAAGSVPAATPRPAAMQLYHRQHAQSVAHLHATPRGGPSGSLFGPRSDVEHVHTADGRTARGYLAGHSSGSRLFQATGRT